MSRNGTSFQPLPGLTGTGDIHIRPAKKPDHFLVTIGHKRVVEYNIRERQVVTNYFTPSHIKLSTPMVYDEITEKNVCVINKNSLLIWDGAETKLDAIRPTNRLYTSAIDILIKDQKVIIVFENGDLQPLECVQRRSQASESFTSFRNSKESIMKTRIFWHKGGLYCALIAKNVVDLIQLSIHSETNEFVQRHVKSLNFEDALDIDLINLEVASITNGNSFIHLQPLFDGKNTEHHKYHLDEDLKPLKLCALDQTRLVGLCAKNSNPDGAVLQVIDVNFGVAINSINIKTMLTEDICCYGGEKILFKQAGSVVCWSLLDLPDGLSRLLGSDVTKSSDQNSKNKIEGGGDLPWIALEDLQVLPAENWAKTIKSQNVKECANLLSIEQQLPSKIRLALVETLLQHTSDQNLLKNIFLASLTRDDLSSFLQQMDFKNVVKLMRLSIDLLQITHPDENQFDSVLLWLESLLEAHYSTFVVAKDENSTAILQETLDLLNNLDQNINMLASVMAQTKIMKKKLAVQQTKNVNLMYSVEIVYF